MGIRFREEADQDINRDKGVMRLVLVSAESVGCVAVGEKSRGQRRVEKHSLQKQSCMCFPRTLTPANIFLRMAKKMMKKSAKQKGAQEQIPI